MNPARVLVVAVLSTALLAGCGGKKGGPTAPPVTARSPAQAIDELIAAWVARDTTLFKDHSLVTVDYGSGGLCSDTSGALLFDHILLPVERVLLPRLFAYGHGALPAADEITAQWLGPFTESSTSPARKLLMRDLRLRVKRSGVETVYEANQGFFMIRGDSAFLPSPGDPARWYLQLWAEIPLNGIECPTTPPFRIIDLKKEYLASAPAPSEARPAAPWLLEGFERLREHSRAAAHPGDRLAR